MLCTSGVRNAAVGSLPIFHLSVLKAGPQTFPHTAGLMNKHICRTVQNYCSPSIYIHISLIGRSGVHVDFFQAQSSTILI